MLRPSIHRARAARAILAVLLLAASAGVAQAQSRADRLLSDKPAPRRGCRILATPNPLPSVAQLADSARLAQAMTAYAREFPVRDGSVFGVYSLSFDASGALERIVPVDYWLPQERVATFQQLIREAALPQQRGAFSVRLRVVPGEQPSFRVGYSEVCPPDSRMSFSLTAPALALIREPQPVRLKMFVGEDGRLVNLSVATSSGDPEIDRWVEATVLRYQFAPGLVDGTPVAMEHEQMVRVRGPR